MLCLAACSGAGPLLPDGGSDEDAGLSDAGPGLDAGSDDEPDAGCGRPDRWTLVDRFCRDVTDSGLTLLDWQGHLANPAIGVRLVPPAGQTFPIHVTATTDAPRVYFDLGGRERRSGGQRFMAPSADVGVADAGSLSFRIAIWPDRDGADEQHTLHLVLGSTALDVPLHVLDQDAVDPNRGWPITVDYSRDDGGFFGASAPNRAVIEQAAGDWGYFFDATGLDPVAAGTERTTVDDFDGWYGARPVVTNTASYTGYLLYAVGIHTVEVRSTGYPSAGPVRQRRGGVEVPGRLCRSGAVEMEVLGNYAPAGWSASTSDDDWYAIDNLTDLPADLASIAHHELGHALFFENGYPRFVAGVERSNGSIAYGSLTSPEIAAYFGSALQIDHRSHFSTGLQLMGITDGALDPASGLGAFGNEYADYGTLPRRRWLITRLDLLAAEAIGYPLRRDLTPFVPLALDTPALPAAARGSAYDFGFTAHGGVPAYQWSVSSGTLPRGVRLDHRSGQLSGTPAASGTFSFEVRVEDQLGATAASSALSLTVP